MLQRGDRVRVRKAETSDDWVPGRVILASENGQAVGLLLDGMVRAAGGFVGGALPLMIDYERETVRGVLDGTGYEIEVRDERE
jgi:hypothetical protein